MAFGPNLWGFVKKIDGLMAVEAKHDAAISRLQTQIDDLKDRVMRLESREEIAAANARSAASAATAALVGATIGELSGRIGRLEANAKTQSRDRKRLK